MTCPNNNLEDNSNNNILAYSSEFDEIVTKISFFALFNATLAQVNSGLKDLDNINSLLIALGKHMSFATSFDDLQAFINKNYGQSVLNGPENTSFGSIIKLLSQKVNFGSESKLAARFQLLKTQWNDISATIDQIYDLDKITHAQVESLMVQCMQLGTIIEQFREQYLEYMYKNT